MKTLYLIIFGIILSVIIGMAIFAIFSTNMPRLIATPQNNSGFYTVIDTPGLNNTYYAYQEIRFSVIIHGYGIYPCIQPDVTIYNNDKPDNPVFHDNQGILLCRAVYREQPENFTISYPSKDDSYLTRLNQTGNYTLNISVGDVSVQRQFSVIDAKYVDWGTNSSSNSEKQTISNENKSNLSTACETKFKPRPLEHTVFPNGTSITVNYVPVFLMKPNSTGKICITNNIASQSTDQSFISAKTTSEVSKEDSETSDVIVVPYPENIVVDNITKTIVYTITTSNDANGFYRINTTFDFCGSGIPLAVGYNSSHLFDNDFPWLGQTMPCPFNSFQSVQTQITGLTGIDVAYITKEYR